MVRKSDRGPAQGPPSSGEGGAACGRGTETLEERVRRILASPSYRQADRDLEFLARDELRPSRLQLEYLKAEMCLAEQGIQSTIVVFGSTRIPEPAQAARRLAAARAASQAHPDDPALERALRIAERIAAKSRYYEMARELGRIVTERCQNERCEFVIMTGGGPGIMEAANRGAYDAGGKTVGLNISLPHEQVPNPYITPELCLRFHYFALRKMHFMRRAKALVFFPGGYGTLDELFETLCLIQTRKIQPLPVVLVGEVFWRRAFDVQFLADEGVIADADTELFRFAESASEIWERIAGWWRARGEEIEG